MSDDPNKTALTDSTGRSIKIRKLTPLDRMRLLEVIGPSLSENTQYLAYASLAAAVTEIDTTAYAFPHHKRDIELVIQILSDEGIDSVAKGYRDNFAGGETGDLERIKN
jgi:hypothetical protein